jgi:hypothetical protein
MDCIKEEEESAFASSKSIPRSPPPNSEGPVSLPGLKGEVYILTFIDYFNVFGPVSLPGLKGA